MSECKLHLGNVVFEITRWCNMQCEHCLRGEREHRKLKKEYIDRFLNGIESINLLTITGGEPTLAIDVIEYIFQTCISQGIEVYNVWVTTNGKIKSQKFLDIMTRFIEYTKEFDGEISGVSISTDQFHDDLPEENYWFYRDYQYFEESKDIHFVKYVIPEGRALDMGVYTNGMREPREETLDFEFYNTKYPELYITDGTLYLNAKGDIVFGCDFSFEHQDQLAHFNIKDKTIREYIFNRGDVKDLIEKELKMLEVAMA